MTKATRDGYLGGLLAGRARQDPGAGHAVALGPYTYLPAPVHASATANGTLTRGWSPGRTGGDRDAAAGFPGAMSRLEPTSPAAGSARTAGPPFLDRSSRTILCMTNVSTDVRAILRTARTRGGDSGRTRRARCGNRTAPSAHPILHRPACSPPGFGLGSRRRTCVHAAGRNGGGAAEENP